MAHTVRANGHKVFLSTERTEHDIPGAVQVLDFDGGIYSAGAKIVVEGKELFHTAMPFDLVEHTIRIMRDAGVSFNLECSSTHYRYVPEDYLRFLESVPVNGMNSELKRLLTRTQTSPGSADIKNYTGEPVYKIVFTAISREQINQIGAAISGRTKMVSFENLIPGFPVIAGEVSDRNINKGVALQKICAYLGTASDQCIAFGDSMNDAEILQAAGIGIAMGNATEDVKQLADRVCGSCEEDGLAKAMLELINL